MPHYYLRLQCASPELAETAKKVLISPLYWTSDISPVQFRVDSPLFTDIADEAAASEVGSRLAKSVTAILHAYRIWPREMHFVGFDKVDSGGNIVKQQAISLPIYWSR